MFGKNLISNGGALVATGLALTLQNIAENRRIESLRKQEELWNEAVEREKQFLAIHKEWLSYKEMEALYKPLQREYAKLLRIQTRLVEVSRFFTYLGIDPADVFSPDGISMESVLNDILDYHLKNKSDQQNLNMQSYSGAKGRALEKDNAAFKNIHGEETLSKTEFGDLFSRARRKGESLGSKNSPRKNKRTSLINSMVIPSRTDFGRLSHFIQTAPFAPAVGAKGLTNSLRQLNKNFTSMEQRLSQEHAPQ